MFLHLARPTNLWHHKTNMSINSAIKPKKGRPPVDTAAINVRLHEDVIKAIDDWRRIFTNIPTRPEAIRRLVTFGLLADAAVADLHVQDMNNIEDFEKQFRQKMIKLYRENHPAEDWFKELPE